MKTAADRLAMRVRGVYSGLVLDYPVRPRARYGWGAPFHPGLEALIRPGVDRYRIVLEGFLAHRADFASITLDSPAAPGDPQWSNTFIPGLDGVASVLIRRGRAASDLSGSGLRQLDEVREASHP